MEQELFNKNAIEFIRISKRAFSLGMQSSTGGNISIRINENLIITKPSGFSLFDCSEKSLVAVNLEGDLVFGNKKPTKEINMHLGIYKNRKDVNAIIHYHSPYATGFAVKEIEIPLVTLHAKRILKRIPNISIAEEGTLELANLVIKELKNKEILTVTMSKHGLVAIGPNLSFAQNIAELVEETAKTALISSFVRNDINYI